MSIKLTDAQIHDKRLRDALRQVIGLPEGVAISDKELEKRAVREVAEICERLGLSKKKSWRRFWK